MIFTMFQAVKKEFKDLEGYEATGHEVVAEIERSISLKTPEAEVFPDQLTNNGWILTPLVLTEVL